MTAADFRKIALSLEGVEEYSHVGLPAFRIGGRKFASLASQADGYGNLTLTLVKGGVKLDHWGGEKLDHFVGGSGCGLKDLRGRLERRRRPRKSAP